MRKNILVGLVLITLLGIVCNNRRKKVEKECTVDEIRSLAFENIDSFQTLDLYIRKTLSERGGDTIYMFKPYSNKETIYNILYCYNKVFDKISYDDQAHLLIIKKNDRLEYKYIKRGNAVLSKNVKYYEPNN